MDKNYYKVIELFFKDDVNPDEIAERLGITTTEISEIVTAEMSNTKEALKLSQTPIEWWKNSNINYHKVFNL